MNSTIFQGYVTLIMHTTTVFTVDAYSIIIRGKCNSDLLKGNHIM